MTISSLENSSEADFLVREAFQKFFSFFCVSDNFGNGVIHNIASHYSTHPLFKIKTNLAEMSLQIKSFQIECYFVLFVICILFYLKKKKFWKKLIRRRENIQGVPKKILLKLIFEFLTLGWVFSGVVFCEKTFLFYKIF